MDSGAAVGSAPLLQCAVGTDGDDSTDGDRKADPNPDGHENRDRNPRADGDEDDDADTGADGDEDDDPDTGADGDQNRDGH